MRFISTLLLAAAFPMISSAADESTVPPVRVVRVPDGGIQPQVVRDAEGATHLVYFKGDAAAGDVHYVRRKAGETSFSAPMRVNSVGGSAIAVGSIRGAQLAVGRGARVHVAWNGSAKAAPRGPSSESPMLYTRMNDEGSGFEKERNLIQNDYGLDGGGSVAADATGGVIVAWHAMGAEKGEAHRRVYLRRSSDEGRTFAAEVAPVSEATGACGCCGMKASLADDGVALLLYRGAKNGVERDLILASYSPAGAARTTVFAPWPVATCPMSSMTFLHGKTQTWAAWEQQGQVFFAAIDPASAKVGPPVHPRSKTGVGTRKHPTLAEDREGNLLFVWAEGTGWNRGGSVAWQVYDAGSRPIGETGRRKGIPVWSFPAAASDPSGGFLVLY